MSKLLAIFRLYSDQIESKYMHDKLFSQYWKLTPNLIQKLQKNQFYLFTNKRLFLIVMKVKISGYSILVHKNIVFILKFDICSMHRLLIGVVKNNEPFQKGLCQILVPCLLPFNCEFYKCVVSQNVCPHSVLNKNVLGNVWG